ncbi:MAG: ABC transporter permease [Streptosporangiales bacterium]|nr:ABC transporter permease [Streptosporangiales bacterium]
MAVGWRLLRSADGRNRIGAVLVLAAVCVSTALLMFAVGANHAFDARAAREAWRFPRADAHGTAVEAASTDYVRGRPITVVELARAGAHPPVPPGMTTFPRPGERWVSPALATMTGHLPADELADRFAGRGAAHRLGPAALVYPDELVAVIGRAATDPGMTARREDDGGAASPTRISAYATTTPSTSDATGYTILAKIAAVLMVVPLLVFGGAAARLTAARRDQRLAALRLVGATPRQVVVMTVAEAVVTALLGVVVGLAVYAAATPPLTRITMMGGSWFLGDLWPGPLWLAGVVVGVPLLVGASAVVGLRRVVVSPLGVASRQTPPRLKAVRAAVAVALLIAFTVAAREAGRLGAGIVVALLGLAFLGLNLLGPWVVGVIGRIVAGTARGVTGLLAGRRLVDDPRATWRTVSGIALVGFVAGFLALFDPSGAPGMDTATNRLGIVVRAADAGAVANHVRGRLDRAHIAARVTVRTVPSPDRVGVTVWPRDGGDVDRVRTALAGTVPGHVFTTPADESSGEQTLFRDIRTGTLVVLVVSFLVAMVSAGITSVSSVLDRRRAYALLRLAGTPLSVVHRARLRETLVPLAVMGGGSLAAGLVCGLPLALASPVSPYGLTLFGSFVVLGTLGVVAATLVSRPLLHAVTESPSPQPD